MPLVKKYGKPNNYEKDASPYSDPAKCLDEIA
jgi:hypothetical protein